MNISGWGDRVVIPYHLKDEDLRLMVVMSPKNREYISFTVVYETGIPDDKGWKKC